MIVLEVPNFALNCTKITLIMEEKERKKKDLLKKIELIEKKLKALSFIINNL